MESLGEGLQVLRAAKPPRTRDGAVHPFWLSSARVRLFVSRDFKSSILSKCQSLVVWGDPLPSANDFATDCLISVLDPSSKVLFQAWALATYISGPRRLLHTFCTVTRSGLSAGPETNHAFPSSPCQTKPSRFRLGDQQYCMVGVKGGLVTDRRWR